MRRLFRFIGSSLALGGLFASTILPVSASAPGAFVFAPARLRAHGPLAMPHTRSLANATASGTVGSMNVVSAEAPVPRPRTRSCTVSLFSGYTFSQYAAQGFGYTPPAACPGPWAKVIFEGDLSISPGVQYDRTADAWLGNTNVFFGTTAEPLANQRATWHVERDVTDLSALFRQAQPGEVEIFNIVSANLGLNGVLGGSSRLVFYEPDFSHPAPAAPDVVLPLSGGYGGELTAVTSPGTLSRTVTLPTNTVRAYLDVFTQSQGGDEFWYSCSSNDIAPALNNCGNTGFREAEISVDGTPAGVAPVYPWIYTGGIDPYLWQPIPGTQTLNFRPYRVDLTPFAALLSDGKPHAIAIGVYDSNNNFATTATLLAYRDAKIARVTGGLTADTLKPPTPMLSENFTSPNTAPNGTETVASARSYTIAGFVNTSHGRVATSVEANVSFSNAQKIVDTATLSEQTIVQRSTVSSFTLTSHDGGIDRSIQTFSYPLDVTIHTALGQAQDVQTTTIAQGYQKSGYDTLSGKPTVLSQISETTSPTDSLAYDAATFQLIGSFGQKSSQTYAEVNDDGLCYSKTVAAANHAITNVTGNTRCP